jgi:glycosyltransferase involved in cell wall biosynthesis
LKYDLACGMDYCYMEDEIRGDTDPLDLVMWVKNGTRTLSAALYSINLASSKICVGQKIVIDDNSSDLSKAIAYYFGWKVIDNEGKGISDAANTALKYVTTKKFCSFEQDVFISPDWFFRIPKLVNGKVVVASGFRVPKDSRSLTNIGLYEVKRYKYTIDAQFGKTLDNTCYNRDWLLGVGGFPKLSVAPGVDCCLLDKVKASGKVWVVDGSVQSNHLHRGVWDEMKHYYWYGKCQKGIDATSKAYLMLAARVLFSPLRGLDIAVSTKNINCFWVYPALRLSSFVGAMRGLF